MGQLLAGIGLVVGIIANTISIGQFVVSTRRSRRDHRESDYRARERQMERLYRNEPVRGRKSYLGCTLTFIIVFALLYGGYSLLDFDMDLRPGVIVGVSLFVAGSLGFLVFSFSRRK
jgi:hypothetical protein